MPTKTQVRPPLVHTAGAVKTCEPPGAESVCSSPPRRGPADVVPLSLRMFRTRSLPSLPPCTARPPGSRAGEVEPRSASVRFSSAWFAGVQFWSSREASGLSSRTLSPQSVRPFQGPLPVAKSSRPVLVSTTTAFLPQIAESLEPHVLGWISTWRFEQSEFQTCRMRPFAGLIVTACPW